MHPQMGPLANFPLRVGRKKVISAFLHHTKQLEDLSLPPVAPFTPVLPARVHGALSRSHHKSGLCYPSKEATRCLCLAQQAEGGQALGSLKEKYSRKSCQGLGFGSYGNLNQQFSNGCPKGVQP